MGLDMYLTKETYIGSYFEHNKAEVEINITVNGKEVVIDPSKVSTINERIGYWRKAHSLHEWFVENCQDGVDECQRTQLSDKNLKELLVYCEDEIDSGELDEYTVKNLELALQIAKEYVGSKNYDVSLYYQSSW